MASVTAFPELHGFVSSACTGYHFAPDRFSVPFSAMLFWRRPSRGIPARLAAQLGSIIKRIFLVANNGHLGPSNLPNDLKPSDLIVQFNLCIHIGHFLSADCSKLFVFRGQEDLGVNFGYPPNPNAFLAIDPDLFRGQSYLLFVDNFPKAYAAPAVLRNIIREPSAVGYVNSSDELFRCYPRPANIDFAGPSTGFVALQLFLEARRRRVHNAKFEIVPLGFEDTPGDFLWHGHNWRFERSFVDAHRLELTLPAAHK